MKRFNIHMFAAILVVMFCWVTSPAALTIEEVTGDDAPGGSPGWVDGIDIEAGILVVGDRSYRLVDETLYLTKDNEPVRKNFFHAEMAIRFLLEGNTVLALWELDDPEGDYRPGAGDDDAPVSRDIQPKMSEPTELEGEIKKEGGVWTN